MITWVLITDGVRDIAYSLSGNLMPVYLEQIGGMSFQQIGWLGSMFSVCMMLVTMPAGWLADKKGERVGIVIGFMIEFVAMFTFMQVRGFLGLCAGVGTIRNGDRDDVTGIQLADQQSGAGEAAWYGLRIVWYQPGAGITTGTVGRSSVMGTLQPTHAFLRDGSGSAMQRHPGMVQIQATKERWNTTRGGWC